MTECVQFLAAACGVVLVVAGIGKLRSTRALERFLVAVGFPGGVGSFAARVLPAAEVVVGASLLCNVLPVAGFTAVAMLAVSFTLVHALSAARAVKTPCRCFGRIDDAMSPRLAVIRSAVLVAAAGAGAVGAAAGFDPAAATTSPSVAIAGVVTGLVYVVAFGLAAQARRLHRLRRRSPIFCRLPAEQAARP